MTLPSTSMRHWVAVLASALIAGIAGLAHAVPVDPSEELERIEPKPERLTAVNLDERLGESVPLDVPFTESTGQEVTLRDYLDGQQPVVLTFNYANCPMLCSLQLARFTESLKQLDRTVGEDFRVVTVSIDPEETPEQAAENKARYLKNYARPRGEGEWHFVVGPQKSTRQLAAAVGFSYDYNEARQEWLHPAVVTLLTPDGRISRYLYGVQYHPETLNLAIVEASEGKIGSVVDRLILYCFHYDETEGRYAPVAMNIMRVGAGSVAVVLGTFLALYWLAEARRRRNSPADPKTPETTDHTNPAVAASGQSPSTRRAPALRST